MAPRHCANGKLKSAWFHAIICESTLWRITNRHIIWMFCVPLQRNGPFRLFAVLPLANGCNSKFQLRSKGRFIRRVWTQLSQLSFLCFLDRISSSLSGKSPVHGLHKNRRKLLCNQMGDSWSRFGAFQFTIVSFLTNLFQSHRFICIWSTIWREGQRVQWMLEPISLLWNARQNRWSSDEFHPTTGCSQWNGAFFHYDTAPANLHGSIEHQRIEWQSDKKKWQLPGYYVLWKRSPLSTSSMQWFVSSNTFSCQITIDIWFLSF